MVTLLLRGTAIASGLVALSNARELLLHQSVKPYRVYTPKEVARFLGVTVEEIIRLVDDEELKAKQVNGRYLILGKAIHDFLTK